MITSFREAGDTGMMKLLFTGNLLHVFMHHTVTENLSKFLILARRPWVDIDGAPTPRIIETVNLCPTEALTWKWNNEEKNQIVGNDQTNHIKFRRPELMEQVNPATEENPVSVKIMEDGPIILKGDFSLTYEGKKKEVHDSMVSICRCGASDHMPFCDGQHRKTGFTG